jgi:hypothetical protein
MSKFTTVTPGRLWQITDLLPDNELTDILSTDWLSLRTHAAELQNRCQVAWDDPNALRIGQYITNQLPQINQTLGTTFTKSGGHFWIDYPGFTVDMHTDGHLAASMQLYWTMPGPEYGTGFYYYKRQDTLLYQFASIPNSGYIMLNHLNEDGSQPLQWHGMFCPVPLGSIRVSSYWQFE